MGKEINISLYLKDTAKRYGLYQQLRCYRDEKSEEIADMINEIDKRVYGRELKEREK